VSLKVLTIMKLSGVQIGETRRNLLEITRAAISFHAQVTIMVSCLFGGIISRLRGGT